MGTRREDRSTRLVLVDDEERTIHTLFAWLESLGYDVRAFTSATEAIEHVTREGADVVITGSHVADMSGVQICASIRDATAHPPAFIGLVSTSEGALANDPAFDAIVRKPCSRDALLNELSRLVPHAVRRPRANGGEPGASRGPHAS
ncbi:MAG: response regulator [Myxococcota bacterium]|nr:response regulator [Myxococcota bacterium]